VKNKPENNRDKKNNIQDYTAKNLKLRKKVDLEPISAIIFDKLNKLIDFDEKSIEELQQLLEIEINNPNYFKLALVHRSLVPFFQKKLQDDKICDLINNERLEYLGDSVFNFIISDYLFHKYPDKKEGELSPLRAKLINRVILGEAAKKLNLDKFVQTSHNARKLIEEGNLSIISNTIEAIVGAIYLDSGLEQTKSFVLNKVLPILNEAHAFDTANYKSILMEFVQSYGINFPTYKLLAEEGPDHLKRFFIGVYINNKLFGTAIANSKKDAEQFAAKKVLDLSNFLL
jgi:ribonuclease-3